MALVRLLARNLAAARRPGTAPRLAQLPVQQGAPLVQSQYPDRFAPNIAAHYDLGNTLYQGFLDSTCSIRAPSIPPGRHPGGGQQAKLRTICERLAWPDDHLLEIGTGWGGLAVYAGPSPWLPGHHHYHLPAQHDYAKAWIEREGLGIASPAAGGLPQAGGTLRQAGLHRDDRGGGHAFLPDYFRQLSRLLKPGGRLLIQAITIADQRHAQYLRGVDFHPALHLPGWLPAPASPRWRVCWRGRPTCSWCGCTITATTMPVPWPTGANASWRWPRAAQTRLQPGFHPAVALLFRLLRRGFWERAISLVQLEAAKPGPHGWSGDLPAHGR